MKLPKADRLSDWLRRPLTGRPAAYAAADVAHLLELHDRLVAQLEELGRLDVGARRSARSCAPGPPARAIPTTPG